MEPLRIPIRLGLATEDAQILPGALVVGDSLFIGNNLAADDGGDQYETPIDFDRYRPNGADRSVRVVSHRTVIQIYVPLAEVTFFLRCWNEAPGRPVCGCSHGWSCPAFVQ